MSSNLLLVTNRLLVALELAPGDRLPRKDAVGILPEDLLFLFFSNSRAVDFCQLRHERPRRVKVAAVHHVVGPPRAPRGSPCNRWWRRRRLCP